MSLCHVYDITLKGIVYYQENESKVEPMIAFLWIFNNGLVTEELYRIVLSSYINNLYIVEHQIGIKDPRINNAENALNNFKNLVLEAVEKGFLRVYIVPAKELRNCQWKILW
jgi:hypothetical protein